MKPADLSASSAARLIYAASKAWDEEELLDEQAMVVLWIRGGIGSPPIENDSAILDRKVGEDAVRKKDVQIGTILLIEFWLSLKIPLSLFSN